MPIHDWTKVPAGLFHHFHQDWSIEIARTLNRGKLPKGVSALVEQRAVATLRTPRTRIVRRTSKEAYANRANRITLKHHLGRTLAVIEIVSPGNKDGNAPFGEFIEKTVDCLRLGIHVLIVDLFPPTARDRFGIHKAVWDEFDDEPFAFPEGKNRTLVSYEAGGEKVAYIEPVAVGDALPDMPLFLTEDIVIEVPLEPTYQAAWDVSPEDFREAVLTGVLPEPDAE